MKLLCRLMAAFLLLAGLAFGQATAFLPPPEKYCRVDANGAPLVGGKLYTYLAGSSTPAATYTDSTAGGTNTNPVILDSTGCANVWLSAGSFKLKLTDANDVQLWLVDEVPGGLGAIWGAITGSITDQADLVAALALKLNTSQLDTDATLAANSDSKIPSQKAVKTYAVPQSRSITVGPPLVIDGTTAGDLTVNRQINFVAEAKNLVFAGPATGANAAPTFRALVAADLSPAIAGVQKIRITSVGTTGSSTYDQVAADMTGTWPTAFADTNYTVQCQGVTPNNPRAGPIFVTGKTTTAITVNFPTEGSVAATYAEIDCSGHQ